MTLTGYWSHLRSSNKSLSCNLLVNLDRSRVMAIQFNGTGLENLGEQAGNFFYSPYNASTDSYLLDGIEVSEYCNLFKCRGGNSIANSIKQYNANRTALDSKKQWSLTLEASFSDDLLYFVQYNTFDNKFQLNYKNTANFYNPIANLSSSYPNHRVYSHLNRIIVVSYKSHPGTTYESNYSVEILQSSSAGVVSLDSFNVKNVIESQTRKMKMFVSPNMTKLLIVYKLTNGSHYQIFKNIDYTRNNVTEMYLNHSQ